ncbi:MAG: sensor domain-containing protein [Janthinobacterium lividum]
MFQLTASSDLLRLVVESAIDLAVIVTDGQGVVVAWNVGARRLLGHSGPAMLGRSLEAILTPEDRRNGRLADEMHQALRDGRADGDCWHLRSDGSRFWGAGLMVPLEVPGAGFVRTVRDRTGERLAGEQLRESEARFHALATSVPQLVFRARRTGHRTWSSPQWEAGTGLGDADSRGLGWLQAIHPDDVELTTRAWDTASSDGEYRVEHRIRHAAQGLYRRHQTLAVPLGDAGDATAEWVGTCTDVEDLRGLRARHTEVEQQLRTLVEGMPQLVWRSCNRGRWTWASPQWLAYTGQTQARSRDHGWLDAVHPDDHAAAHEAWADAQSNGLLDVEFRVRHAAEDRWVWHRTRSLPVHDAAGGIVEWLGTTTDIQTLKELQQRQQALLGEARHHARALEAEIAQRRSAEAELLHQAFHDELTGLRNRAFFIQRLRAALQPGHDGARPRCAVLFLDLDGFKLVNDSMGHRNGDLLLIEVGRRLQACAGPDTTLARLGGDEFALLSENLAGMEDVVALAQAIRAAMRQPLWIGTQEIFASFSIGVAEALARHTVPEELLRDADIAMYQAKRHNAGGHVVFTGPMHDGVVDALRLQTDLRNAVLRGEFVLHYQPICDATTRAITGMEALVRWNHPRRGLVHPDGFIAVAEETGLIREIGRWVLREACGQMMRWRERFPLAGLRLSVNTSGEELRDPHFVAATRDIIAATGIDPRCVQLEVTESVFLHQPEQAGETLAVLRAMGLRIALDDFGTGYSSLGYLDRYAMDTIKVDRSFVARMSGQPRSVAIVRTIVALGQAMALDIVAEGIEHEHQLRVLRDLGCGSIQGFLLGRPVTGADMTLALERQGELSRVP